MPSYTPITLDDMRATLKAERGWVEDNACHSGGEIVFRRDLTSLPGVQIKVYTSIKPSTEGSRDCGKDAIRVCAIRNVKGAWRGLVSSARVNRTQGWRDNLMERIQSVFEICKERV